MRDLSEFRAHVKRHWWFPAIQAVVAVVVVCLALALVRSSSTQSTSHLVLRPASSLPAAEVSGAIDGLRPDGSLVQTVLHVLGSDLLLQTAVTTSNTNDGSRYAISANVQPGSAFFDQSVTGPDAATVQNLSHYLSIADTAYITRAYSAYSLDVVGTDVSTHDSFPPKPAVVFLALMLGFALGIALLFADWWFLEPRRRRQKTADADVSLEDLEPENDSDAGGFAAFQLVQTAADKGDAVPVGRNGLVSAVESPTKDPDASVEGPSAANEN